MRQFMDLFKFDASKVLFVGVERECFLTDFTGLVVPMAYRVLTHLNDPMKYGYELSACQLEERIGPCSLDRVLDELIENNRKLEMVQWFLNFKRLHAEVGPEYMPLDVYPDPTGRYQAITAQMPKDVLLAACRIIGTHIHIGMPDHETALRVYNKVIGNCSMFCSEGNGSNGHRLEIYRAVAPDCDPLPYESWQHFHSVACERGFSEDPRRCWNLIRISVHGTIEFRMFGATPCLEKIVRWAKLCHNMCKEAMS